MAMVQSTRSSLPIRLRAVLAAGTLLAALSCQHAPDRETTSEEEGCQSFHVLFHDRSGDCKYVKCEVNPARYTSSGYRMKRDSDTCRSESVDMPMFDSGNE